MRKEAFKYIYGPVYSWRLKRSLGIDLLSQKEKICTFDCTYCQLGKTLKFTRERKVYVPSDKILEELKALPAIKIDYLTFSGRGEPALAKNLGEAIRKVKGLGKGKVAVLTNSTLLSRKNVRRDLLSADFAVLKLDASSQKLLGRINRPAKGITFASILKGIMQFKREYKGRLGLQIMFIEKNKDSFRELSELAVKIHPDEIQINTPLRPCGVKPLSREEIAKITAYFRKIPALKDTKIVSVYEARRARVQAISVKDTLKRRGKIEN